MPVARTPAARLAVVVLVVLALVAIWLLGWRLLADALASIQIRLLSDEKPAGALAEEATRQLFAALRQALPPQRYQALLALSGQAVRAWQQARRPPG